MRVGRPERQVKPLGHCFRAAHPLIGLAIEILPFVDMFPTLAVRLQARTSDPDIVFYDCICDSPLTASHAVRGHLVDRTPHLEAACITKAALDAASWQGKLGSVPFGGSRQVLFDDEARCREAALAPTEPDPAEPWTREQVVEAAERLADPAEGRGGSASSSRSAPVRSSASAGPGRGRFEPGRVRGERLPRRAALPRAYRVVRTVYIEWKVRPPGPFDPNLPVEPFGNSRIAMLLAGTFDAFVLADKHGDLEVGVAPFPDFAKGEPVTPTGAWHIGVDSRTQHKEAARAFIRRSMI